jgi:hypothetical protein
LNKLLLLLKGKESLYAIFFVFVLTFSTITESLGLHFIIGAFFAENDAKKRSAQYFSYQVQQVPAIMEKSAKVKDRRAKFF